MGLRLGVWGEELEGGVWGLGVRSEEGGVRG
jgi:hypothetical protein